MSQSLGDRQKSYETLTERSISSSDGWLMARADGHNFSKFTKKFDKPFDQRFAESMRKTCEDLLTSSYQIVTVYTQSDEITMIFDRVISEPSEPEKYQPYPFNGRLQKLSSLLAGFISVRFCHHMKLEDPSAHFDCRVFLVPRKEEVFNNTLWRYQDGYRNAISAIAQSLYSHKQLHKKTTGEKIAMIGSLDAYGSSCLHGVFFKKVQYEKDTEGGKCIRVRVDRFVQKIEGYDPTFNDVLLAKYRDS